MPEGTARGASRPFGLPEPVTPWRRDIVQMADEIAAKIIARADPEQRFAIADEIARDLVHIVKSDLKQHHGRVFDRLMDGPLRVP